MAPKDIPIEELEAQVNDSFAITFPHIPSNTQEVERFIKMVTEAAKRKKLPVTRDREIYLALDYNKNLPNMEKHLLPITK